MESFKGIYKFGEDEQQAEITQRKQKLIITLQDGREVFWFFEHITRLDLYRFTYTSYPPQGLHVSSSAIADQIEAVIQQRKHHINAGKVAPLAKLLLILITLLVLSYVFVVPWAASALASRFPVSYEKAIGDQAFAALSREFKVDKGKTKYINEFFRHMQVPSDYNIHVTVVKGDVMNAYALPGGNIVVYDKIIHGMSAYPELAALLAHEFTHVQKRHTVHSMLRQFGSRVFISLIAGDATAVGGVVINHADELKGLSYSRSLEKEADENGVRILSERNIDCLGFVGLFAMLKKEAGEVKTAEWMNSHPDLEKRIRNVKENDHCKSGGAKTDSTLHRLFLQLKTAE